MHRDFRMAVARCMAGKSDWPLFVHSPVGRGKTRGALCACDRVEYATYHTVDSLTDAFLHGNRADLEYLLARAEVCVLDEIGAKNATPEGVYGAVKMFADLRETRPGTIYLSNLGPAGVARLFDERIVSRLACGTLLELRGSDRRMS